MANILIIDDDHNLGMALSHLIEKMGHQVSHCSNLEQGLKTVSQNNLDVIFLDVNLPDGNGLNAIEEIRQKPHPPEVVIITGQGDPDGAELAIKSGAWDYIQKPASVNQMNLLLARVIQYKEEKKIRPVSTLFKRENIIGHSSSINKCLDLAAQAAETQASVLITGETGTGKELIASAIHNNSKRNKNNFVIVDCASLPETLVESVLFGHIKGAFTGADRTQEGLVKQASGGTLFLDEIGELSLSNQKSFLRVLQEHRFRPVGGDKETKSDFRLITATNRDLEKMVKEGSFRQDLLFRIRSLIISIPPLRERNADIKILTNHFINQFCEMNNRGTKGFSPEFIHLLNAYDWPGNIRELANTIASALTSAGDDPMLYPKHLPTYIRVKMARISIDANYKEFRTISTKAKEPLQNSMPTYRDFRDSALAESERNYFNKLMEMTKGSIREACEISGLGRTRLYSLIKKHNVSRFGWPVKESSTG